MKSLDWAAIVNKQIALCVLIFVAAYVFPLPQGKIISAVWVSMPPFVDGIESETVPARSAIALPRHIEKDKAFSAVIRAFQRSLQEPVRIARGFGNICEDEFHLGVDISMPVGTPVRCPAQGIIVKTGADYDLGYYLVVSHGKGLYTIYGHLAAFAGLRAGDKTEAGRVIAWSGYTGRVAEPALHFAALKDSWCLNPEVLFSVVSRTSSILACDSTRIIALAGRSDLRTGSCAKSA
jgi:murein DD-endopeptidase MepM/ murein hydrolase activator NlpD